MTTHMLEGMRGTITETGYMTIVATASGVRRPALGHEQLQSKSCQTYRWDDDVKAYMTVCSRRL